MKYKKLLLLSLLSFGSYSSDLSLVFVNEDKGSGLGSLSDALFPEAKDSDGHYSQSLSFGYGFNVNRNAYLNFSIQSDTFTPGSDAKNESRGVVGERPFASSTSATANLKTKVLFRDFDLILNPSFSLGLVGEDCGGGLLQDFLHSVIGATEYAGWADEVESKAFYTYGLQAKPRFSYLNGKFAIEPAMFYTGGNLVNYYGVGGSLRLATFDMRRDFGLSHIGVTQSGNLSPSNGASGLGFSSYVGFETRFMSENYYLEGKTTKSNQQLVNMEDTVTDLVVGFNVYYRNVLLDFAVINRSKEYTTQDEEQSFMRANVAFTY